MAMFLLVGCQTTQSAETETQPEVVKEVTELPNKKELPKKKPPVSDNPFADLPIMPGQVVTSNKPVICGRIDIVLQNIYQRFGEIPLFVGKSESKNPDGRELTSMVTLLYNKETGTFTFVEQMPLENRLVCMLSSGQGKIESKSKPKGTVL